MKYRPLFITFSALFFNVPFFIPSLCMLIILFPAPLIYVLCSIPITFFEGILFGSLVWGFHLSAVCSALFTMADGTWFARGILPALFVGYMILLTALWLYISSRCIARIHASIPLRYFACSLNLFFYLFFIERYCLSIGQWNGYPFANPLIALAHKSTLVSLVAYSGISGALFLFCMFAGSLALFICRPMISTTLCLAICAAPWLLAMANPPAHHPAPSWLIHVGHLPLMLTACDGQSMAACLTWQTRILLTKHPHLDLIIMPESACTVPPDWSALPAHPMLCLGTFTNGTCSRTNICCFYGAAGLQSYAKQHTLPLAEGIPPEILHSFCSEIFFKNTHPTSRGTQPRPQFPTPFGITLTPFICSELFCGSPLPHKTDKTIIALCNDWWFPAGYFPRIMALTARLKAIAWQKPIVYISYHFAHYFDECGFGHPLATTPNLFFIE